MISIRKIKIEELDSLYELIYSSKNPEWKNWDAPYFSFKFIEKDEFLAQRKGYLTDNISGIYEDNRLIGTLSYYYEDENTKWLEVGIVIYDRENRNRKIGKIALSKWIDKIFTEKTDIMHIGLTTWSGNIAMENLASSINMKEEARIRKVRYYNGYYYDSVKFGILRSEWEEKRNKENEKNIYDIRYGSTKELVEILNCDKNVEIEKIVSYNSSTDWQDNDTSEYVILLEGESEIEYKNGAIITLRKGDTLLIPGHTVHRVKSTNDFSLWICVKYKD